MPGEAGYAEALGAAESEQAADEDVEEGLQACHLCDARLRLG